MKSPIISSKNIKVIIFDLDGTLVDAYRAVWRSLNTAFKEHNLPPKSFENVKRSVGWGERTLIRSWTPPEMSDQVLKSYRKAHDRDLKEGVKFLPGAKKLLLDLHKEGYILAIASNRPTKFCEKILKILKVRKYFKIVLCADQIKKPKPSGEMLKVILKRLKLKPRHALFIGDMIIDVKAGANARIKTIVVTTGSSKKSELLKTKPFKTISRLPSYKSLICR